MAANLPPIPDVHLNYTDVTTYTMTNVTATRFYYIDSKQKATIQAQEITISGGVLEVDLKFNW